MKTVIIKYNSGNIRSVQFALERIGVNGILSDDASEIQSADKVIFPGVGEASTAMQYLKDKGLDKVITTLKQPVLGICLGMQLMCKYSAEGNTDCLGIFDLKVEKFQIGKKYKVPQIGWNNIYDLKGNLFSGITNNEFVYFVHSYYVEQNKYSIARTDYVIEYSSAIQKDNFYAVQFHPEKSGSLGERIIENFLTLNS
jgi:glutamine amidotransferase